MSLQLGMHQRRLCAENEQRERGRCRGRVTIVETRGGPSWKSYRRILLHGRIEPSLFSRLYSKSWPACPTHALRVYTSHVCERFYEYDHEHEHALWVSDYFIRIYFNERVENDQTFIINANAYPPLAFLTICVFTTDKNIALRFQNRFSISTFRNHDRPSF